MTAALVPAAFVAVRLCAAVGTGLDELAGSVRPPACGSSATRCAACGAGDHTMLDARCPLAPPVRHRGDG